MKYWLMKTEPTTFSIDDLSKSKGKTTAWEGVRNYQARNMMRDDMKIGDLVFFYHSACKVPGIVALCEVVKESYPDHTSWNKKSKYFDIKSSKENPRWFMVDIKLKKKFKEIASLQTIKETKGLEKMVLVQKGSRLSISPVTKKEFDIITKLSV